MNNYTKQKKAKRRTAKCIFWTLCIAILLCTAFLLKGKPVKARSQKKASIKVQESVSTQFNGVKDHISPEKPFRIIVPEEQTKNVKDLRAKIDTVDSAIPAGAFAKGMLTSGLHVHMSPSSSSDPKPLLIRVTDFGTLPRKFKSDSKFCDVVASAYGDLSSKRIKIRLENLTCVERATGEIIDTAVAGFIAGEDGQAGLRGRVVEAPRGGDISDVVTEFLPAIEVSPGRIIDIIFTEKAEIGSSRVKQEIAKKRDSKRRETASKAIRQLGFKS